MVDIVNGTAAARARLSNEEVLEAVHAVMHRARQQQQAELGDQFGGLTPMEGRLLAFFVRQPGASLSDLVAHTARDKGQLARLLNRLKEQGLLSVVADPDDRRISRLYPTDAALALHQDLAKVRNRIAAAAVAGLSDKERKLLVTLLVRVKHNLEVDRNEVMTTPNPNQSKIKGRRS